MKIKKQYEFTHHRQLWRILPTSNGKVIIEERDTQLKEAYFNCLEINNGKKIFESLQLDEKFWIGIEDVYQDIIFFHRYVKPDMPAHKGIIAFDINSKSILWENTEYNFLFIANSRLFCYRSFFEGKKYFALDYLTGGFIEELGGDYEEINRINNAASGENEQNDYIFPEPDGSRSSDPLLLNQINKENLISGKIESASAGDLLFIHGLENSNRGIRNIFTAAEISTGKTIFKEILYNKIEKFLPETFFLKGNLLFLLKEKDTLVVYSLK